MRLKRFTRGLMITIVLGAVLLATSAYASTCELAGPGTMAYPDFSGGSGRRNSTKTNYPSPTDIRAADTVG